MAGNPHPGLRRAVFVLINLINLVNVRLYGETEFWFAIIKVVAIVGMIVFGAWLLVSGNGGRRPASPTCGSRAALCRMASPGW